MSLEKRLVELYGEIQKQARLNDKRAEQFYNLIKAIEDGDEKVAVDDVAAAGYLGAAANDGVLRTAAPFIYTDGGNFITLSFPSSPTFDDLTLTGNLGCEFINSTSINTIEALGIDDDDFVSWTPKNNIGLILITCRHSSQKEATGLVWYRVLATHGTMILLNGGKLEVTTGALNGTTGTDGKATLSANQGDNKLYLENRLGINVWWSMQELY